jgi:thiaminase/transcriptional activator TenA
MSGLSADLRATAGEIWDAQHRHLFVRGIGDGTLDLERERMVPTTRGYTDFMLRTATVGDFAELVAALLPCVWGFNEIGYRLAERGLSNSDYYARWIRMYASDEFTGLVDWLRELTDRISTNLPEASRDRMRDVFLTSSRYELSFWEMARTLEAWPQFSP